MIYPHPTRQRNSPGLVLTDSPITPYDYRRNSVLSTSDDAMTQIPQLCISKQGMEFAALFFIPSKMSFMFVCQLEPWVVNPSPLLDEILSVIEGWIDLFFTLFKSVGIWLTNHSSTMWVRSRIFLSSTFLEIMCLPPFLPTECRRFCFSTALRRCSIGWGHVWRPISRSTSRCAT